MKNRNLVMLVLVLILALVVVYIDLPNSPGLHVGSMDRDFEIKQGLDLQGGVQVLLEADLPPGEEVDPEAMELAARIISNRVNALGVTEPLIQTQGARRVIVELPGVGDPDEAIATIRETSLLEFVDAGYEFVPQGTMIQTTYPELWSEGAATRDMLPSEQVTATLTITSPARVYATVLTGQHLKGAEPYRDPNSGELGVSLELTEEGAQIFADITTAHADYNQQPYYYISIVLDKEVISSPHITSPIPDGMAQISGNFTLEEVQRLAIQLRFGALPIPLRVEAVRTIGPTLGQDSVQRSIQAGIVGLGIVLLFMLIYYRLPGLLADMALILYGLLNLAVYKAGWPVLLIISLLMMISYLVDRKDAWPLILGGLLLLGTVVLAAAGFTGVTLTLPAITGFILSTGMAVDANILVFERMKEELRVGRSLGSAIEAGFSRAWTSIRDSNISTLITCAILYYFGSRFGAGAVQGFAITLALGVIINMFTAITVTRTLMRVVFDWFGDKLGTNKFLLGL